MEFGVRLKVNFEGSGGVAERPSETIEKASKSPAWQGSSCTPASQGFLRIEPIRLSVHPKY